MTNKSKAKGSRFEREVADYLAANGFPEADRAPLRGSKDRGDVKLRNWAIECKNTSRIDLASAVDEAELEAINASLPNYAAVIKRRGKGVAGAYLVMPLSEFVKWWD